MSASCGTPTVTHPARSTLCAPAPRHLRVPQRGGTDLLGAPPPQPRQLLYEGFRLRPPDPEFAALLRQARCDQLHWYHSRAPGQCAAGAASGAGTITRFPDSLQHHAPCARYQAGPALGGEKPPDTASAYSKLLSVAHRDRKSLNQRVRESGS